MNSDIHFNRAEGHMLLIDTDSYAGNFERAIAAFCVGACSEYSPVERIAKAFRDGDVVDRAMAVAICNKVDEVLHSEYGEVQCAIWPTANLFHNGYPCYNSVAIFLDEPLTPEEFALVSDRARIFCAAPPVDRLAPFAITDIAMLRYQTSIKTERVL